MVIIITLLFPKNGLIFLCGGLGSIMNPDTLNNIGFLFVSGFFSFIIHNLTKNLFANIGGKPGTIAFISNLLTFLLVYLISLSKTYNYEPINYIIDNSYYSSLNVYIYLFGPLVSMIASLLVYIVAENIKDIISLTNRLIPYCIVCSFGCVYFLVLSTEYRKLSNLNVLTYGQMYINFVHIGCLVALTIKPRYANINEKYFFQHYIISGILSGFLGIGLMGILLFGGKHGLCAFLGNLIYIYFYKIFLIEKISKENIKNVIEINNDVEIKLDNQKVEFNYRISEENNLNCENKIQINEINEISKKSTK